MRIQSSVRPMVLRQDVARPQPPEPVAEPPRFSGKLSQSLGIAALGLASFLPGFTIPARAQAPVVTQQATPETPAPAKPIPFKTYPEFIRFLAAFEQDVRQAGPEMSSQQLAAFEKRLAGLSPAEAASWVHRTVPELPSNVLNSRPIPQQLEEARVHPFIQALDTLLASARKTGNTPLEKQIEKYWVTILMAPAYNDSGAAHWPRITMRYSVLTRLNRQFGTPNAEGKPEYPLTIPQGLQFIGTENHGLFHLLHQTPRLRKEISQWFVTEVQQLGLTKTLALSPEKMVTMDPAQPPVPLWNALNTVKTAFIDTVAPEQMYRDFEPANRTSTSIVPLMNQAYDRFYEAVLAGKPEEAKTEHLLLKLMDNELYGTNKIVYNIFSANLPADLSTFQKAHDPVPMLDIVLKQGPLSGKSQDILRMMTKHTKYQADLPVALQAKFTNALVQLNEDFLTAVQSQNAEKAEEIKSTLYNLHSLSDNFLSANDWKFPDKEVQPAVEKWRQQTLRIIEMLSPESKTPQGEAETEKLFALLTVRNMYWRIDDKAIIKLIGSPQLDKKRLVEVANRLSDNTKIPESVQIRYLNSLNEVTGQYIEAIGQNRLEAAQQHATMFNELFGARRTFKLDELFSDRSTDSRPSIRQWDLHSSELAKLCAKALISPEKAPDLLSLIRYRDDLSPVSANDLLDFFLDTDIQHEESLNFLKEKLNNAKCDTPSAQTRYLNRLNTWMEKGVKALESGNAIEADRNFKTMLILTPFQEHFKLSTLKPDATPEASAVLSQAENLQANLLKQLDRALKTGSVGNSAIEVLVQLQQMRPTHPEQTAMSLIGLLDKHNRSSSIPHIIEATLEGVEDLAVLADSGATIATPQNAVRQTLSQALGAQMVSFVKTPPANKTEASAYSTFVRGACWLASSKFKSLDSLSAWQQAHLEALMAKPSLEALKHLQEEYALIYIPGGGSSVGNLGQTEQFLATGRPLIARLVNQAGNLMGSDQPAERALGTQMMAALPELTPQAYMEFFLGRMNRENNATLRPQLYVHGRDAFAVLDQQMNHPNWNRLMSPADLAGRVTILRNALEAISSAKANRGSISNENQLTPSPLLNQWNDAALNSYILKMQPLFEQALSPEKGPEWHQAAIEGMDKLVNLFPDVLETDYKKAGLFPVTTRTQAFTPVLQRYLQARNENAAGFNASEAEALCRVMRWMPDEPTQASFRSFWSKTLPGDIATKGVSTEEATRQVAALRFLPPTTENVALFKTYLGLGRPLAFSREGLGTVVNAWFWQDWMSVPQNSRHTFLHTLQTRFLAPTYGTPIEPPPPGFETTPAQDLVMHLMNQSHLGKAYNHMMGRSMGSEMSLAATLSWGDYPLEPNSSALDLRYVPKHVLESLPPDLSIAKIKEAQHKFSVEFCKQFSNSSPQQMAEMRRIHEAAMPVIRRFTRHRIETLDPAILDNLSPDIRKDLKWALETLEKYPTHERALQVTTALGRHMVTQEVQWSTQTVTQGRYALLQLMETLGRVGNEAPRVEGQDDFLTEADQILSAARLPQDSVISWQAYQPERLPENWTQPNPITENWRAYGKQRQLQAAYRYASQLGARDANPMRLDRMILPPVYGYRSMEDFINTMLLKIQLSESAYDTIEKQNAHFDTVLGRLKKQLEDRINGVEKDDRQRLWISFTNQFLDATAHGKRPRKERLELLQKLGVSASDIEFYTSDFAKNKLKQ